MPAHTADCGPAQNLAMTAPNDADRLRFWAYVAAFGALWGGTEITLGAFLHTLRVPMTGFFLSALAALLLVAQRQVFPARGSTLATGIVAALLKSLSPGGIIVGPMIGIVSEALLVELALFIAPQARLSAVMAGVLSTYWALTQGLIKQIVVYGTAIIDVYTEGARRILASLGLEVSVALWALLTLLGLLSAIGATAGALGHRLGLLVRQRAQARHPAPEDLSQASTPQSQRLHRLNHAEDTPSATYRRRMAPFAGAALALQFGAHLSWALLALPLILIPMAFWAKDALKAMWWPRFWLLTILATLAAGVLFATRLQPSGEPFGLLFGLTASLRMILRGAFVFAFVSWLTRAIRPREMVGIWARVGLPHMGLAVTTAFNLLPTWLDTLRHRFAANAPKRRSPRYIWNKAIDCLVEASAMAEKHARELPPPPPP